MRYTVEMDGDQAAIVYDATVPNNSPKGKRPDNYIGPAFGPAEAHIIAWALNEIAEGGLIYRQPGQDEYVGFDHLGRADYHPIAYDGPTDGVRP